MKTDTHAALDEGIPITTPEFYRTIDTATAQRVFRADGAADPIPLLDERISVMREAGQVLCEVRRSYVCRGKRLTPGGRDMVATLPA